VLWSAATSRRFGFRSGFDLVVMESDGKITAMESDERVVALQKRSDGEFARLLKSAAEPVQRGFTAFAETLPK